MDATALGDAGAVLRRQVEIEITPVVLDVAAEKYDFKLDWESFDWGGDRYLSTGEVLPDSAVAGIA